MLTTKDGHPLRCWNCSNLLTEKEATESPYFCEVCERTHIKVAPYTWHHIECFPDARPGYPGTRIPTGVTWSPTSVSRLYKQ